MSRTSFGVSLAVLTLSCAAPLRAQQATETFPFVMPWGDASRTVIDISDLNPAPLEEKHCVVTRDGHFYDQPKFQAVWFEIEAKQ